MAQKEPLIIDLLLLVPAYLLGAVIGFFVCTAYGDMSVIAIMFFCNLVFFPVPVIWVIVARGRKRPSLGFIGIACGLVANLLGFVLMMLGVFNG